MNNSFHTEEYIRRNKQFNDGIIELNTKYINFFESRHSMFISKKHDSIENHFVINSIEAKSIIKITSAELPKYITSCPKSSFQKINFLVRAVRMSPDFAPIPISSQQEQNHLTQYDEY